MHATHDTETLVVSDILVSICTCCVLIEINNYLNIKILVFPKLLIFDIFIKSIYLSKKIKNIANDIIRF